MERKSATGKAYAGLTLSAFALDFCVPVGILFVSVATGAAGIVLGTVGYALGARRIGSVAVVLCAAAMFSGLLVGQGAILASYDAALDGVKEAPQAPFSDPGRDTQVGATVRRPAGSVISSFLGEIAERTHLPRYVAASTTERSTREP